MSLHPDTTPPRPDIHAFTGLRAIASWIVVAYHIRADLPFPASVQAVVAHGEYAVDLFFVMSGYVLALSYGPRFHHPAALGDGLRFLGFRLARIYPTHAVVLGLYCLVPLLFVATGRLLPPGRFDLINLGASALLVQNWGALETLDWNVPAWSISAEFLFYLSFPLAAAAVGCLRASTGPAQAVAMVASLASLVALGYAAGGLAADIPHVGALRCLLECTLGMILLEAARLWRPGPHASNALTVAAFALAALFGTGLAPDYAVLPAAILCLLWSLLEPRNLASRLLARPVMLWLGRISFVTYIVHYLVKDTVKLLLVGHIPAAAAQATYFATVLAASALLHHAIERPGQRAGQRLTQLLLTRLPTPNRTLPRQEPTP